ncbi:ABC transporter permease [Microscilla marina]|uniref:Putative ABC transporter ATP-binding protein n=1 Tax=Microscilla marina ATCC 23134 TaxID=313606 RepID=A1ZVN9_MICM2|nr:ABC transporter permease [Microscilla marina]EAY25582.1 putative ABC transporter ATP-binding protein [Microscilla marina ATCC 23134]
MFDLDKWNEIYATIKKHKLRTALTAFGVFWGIFMLIVLLGAGRGFQNGVEGSFDVAKNAVFVWGRRTSEPFKGFQAGRRIQFTNDDAEAIRHTIPEIDVIAPRNQLRGDFTVNYKTKNASFEVRGEYPDYLKVRPAEMLTGRFVNERDIEKKRKVAVIGTRVQELLFEEGVNPLGKYIDIKGIPFKVVGTIKGKGDANDIKEAAERVIISNTALQQAFNQVNKVGFFAFTPKNGVPAVVIEKKIKALLSERHSIAPKDKKALGSANVEKEYRRVQGLFFIIGAFSWFVSIGTIIAGAVGVSNIMLVIVRERTKEIGVRKALGATPWSIISLILQESIVITALSGYFGLLAGTALMEFINSMGAEGAFFKNPEVDMTIAISALVTLVVTGTFAGFIPARKAAKVNPVEALSDE